MLARKKPVLVNVSQWFKNGDHPEDYTGRPEKEKEEDWEGSVVRRYRTPKLDGQTICQYCGQVYHVHGWIDTMEGGHIVCPGDWIVTGVLGERYPCKPDAFEKTYELIKE